MNDSQGLAAPESGSVSSGNPVSDPDLARFTDDPEIAALLDFEPVPRQIKKDNGWSRDLQRLFIAKLAVHGSPGKACKEIRKFRSGVDKLTESEESESFRAAWKAAVDLAERRRVDFLATGRASLPSVAMPFVDNRRKRPLEPLPAGPAPGEVLNEFGEREDGDSLAARAEEARDSISAKLLRSRRLFLAEIAPSPGKRAAFEILAELPIDWERAERLEPQDDEPWRRPSLRNADMLLTAEAGWLGGALVHGPDKVAELRRAVDDHRSAEGLDPVDWDSPPAEGDGRSAPDHDDERSGGENER